MSDLYPRKILVTGASGFVGSHLCRRLVNDYGDKIQLLALANPSSNRIDQRSKSYQYIDLCNYEALSKAVLDFQPTEIVHLAGVKTKGVSTYDFKNCYLNNLLGTLNLVSVCEKLIGLNRFIHLGSSDEYGRIDIPFKESDREQPLSAYGLSKLAATQLLQGRAIVGNFPVVILRPTIIYGPGQGGEMFLPSMIQSVVAGKRFSMSSGLQTRDFIYIDDVVRGICLALVAQGPDLNGQIINLSSGFPVRIADLAKKVVRMIGFDENLLLDIGAMKTRVGEATNYASINGLAKVLLGWDPLISLEEGLQYTINYFVDQNLSC
jgi:UDP-glucose 4-epimerase